MRHFCHKIKNSGKSYWFLIVNKDGSCESENHCSGNSYDNVINVFVDWPHVWVILTNYTENNIMLYFLRKQNHHCSKEKLGKIINIKAWHICGRDVFWRNIWQGHLPNDTWKENFCMPKGDFEALVAELRSYFNKSFIP